MSARPVTVVLAVVAASLAWVATFSLAHAHGLAAPALAALGTLVALWLHARLPELRAQWRPSLASALWGVGAGGALIGATYALYPLARALLPGLEEEVRALYQSALAEPRVLLPTLLFVVVAEEALWRGALLGALRVEHSAPVAVVLSSLLYAAAQAGAGSPVLAVAAFALGICWGALALFTRGLFAPFVAHLMWTPTVLLLWPLEGR